MLSPIGETVNRGRQLARNYLGVRRTGRFTYNGRMSYNPYTAPRGLEPSSLPPRVWFVFVRRPNLWSALGMCLVFAWLALQYCRISYRWEVPLDALLFGIDFAVWSVPAILALTVRSHLRLALVCILANAVAFAAVSLLLDETSENVPWYVEWLGGLADVLWLPIYPYFPGDPSRVEVASMAALGALLYAAVGLAFAWACELPRRSAAAGGPGGATRSVAGAAL
jgi:hypothetical protein